MTVDLLYQWGSLGIALYHKDSTEADPEQLLMDSLPFFSEDRKLLALVTTWLLNNADLVHVERIKKLSQHLDQTSKIWLAGICNKMAKKDKRWAILCKIRTDKMQVSQWNELQGMRVGFDQDFLDAGLRVALYKENDEKKILPKALLLKHRLFALRMLFGTNWRADFIWMRYHNPQLTLYAIAKKLGCNTETVYRLQKQLQTIGDAKINQLVSLVGAS